MKIFEHFTKHPNDYSETYLQHLGFSIKYFFVLLKTAMILLVHGIFPFLFTFTTSSSISKINLVFQQRRKYDLNTYHALFAYIGETPLYTCKHFIVDKPVSLSLKCEFFNPSLSIKDKIVLHMHKK
jgi:hypothetical protein